MDHSGLPSARIDGKEKVPRILNPTKESSAECPKIYRKSVLHLLKYRF